MQTTVRLRTKIAYITRSDKEVVRDYLLVPAAKVIFRDTSSFKVTKSYDLLFGYDDINGYLQDSFGKVYLFVDNVDLPDELYAIES